MLTLELQRDEALPDAQVKACPDAAFFELWCQRTVDYLRQTSELLVADRLEISLLLTTPDAIRLLNRDYRTKDSATNVLSFPSGLPVLDVLDEDSSRGGSSLQALGDLVFCAEVVQTEAQAQDKALLDHWAHLTVHGVLHLVGLDHENDKEAAAMEAAEIRILSNSGVENPY